METKSRYLVRKENNMENLILSMPKHGWCNFRLSDEEKEFTASLSYLTDVMYDTLKMCLTYLQTGAAAVMYDREGEGTFLFVMSEYDVYVLDENLPSGMVHFENLRADDICENILNCYYADTIDWLNFANMNEQNEKEYKKYEQGEAAEVHAMVKEIRKLLNERTGRKSKWTEIRCDFFDEEEKRWLVDAWKTGDDNEEGEVIAKISESGEVVYLDTEAEDDEYAKEVIGEKLKDLA